ncbi:lamin tail domain-containing protein 2 [Gastrophryne carolinensis]
MCAYARHLSPCPLEIAEVNPSGLFIRIVNVSQHQAVDISGFILWQLEGGHPVTMYRFPHNLILPGAQRVTVWASAAKVSHNPPTDLSWKGRVYFRSSSQCITVLARPNGQVWCKDRDSLIPLHHGWTTGRLFPTHLTLHSNSPPSLEAQSRLNTSSPLVRLVAQKSARSRHGFKFLSYVPFTFDLQRV